MNKLSFEHFCQIKEMAVYGFGKNKGKHINDVDRGYATWLLNSIQDSGKIMGSFAADDGSGSLSKDQVIQALKIRSKNQNVAPTSVNKPIQSVSNTVAISPTTATAAQSPRQSLDDSDPDNDFGLEDEPQAPQDQPPAAFDSSKYTIDPAKISEYQKAIEDAFLKSNKHLVINALAGTGKSTVLKHISGKFSSGQRWLYLVFNKKNQQEASEGPKAFPPNIKVQTSHSFLLNVLKRTKKEKPNLLKSSLVPSRKLPKVMDSDWFLNLVMDLEERLPREKRQRMLWNFSDRTQVNYNLKTRVQELTSLAKNYAVNPEDSDAISKIKSIFNTHQDDRKLTPHIGNDRDPGPSFVDEFVTLAIEVLKKTSTKGGIGDRELDQVIDYDDMIWWPTLHPNEAIWPGKSDYQVALIDEVQDFNDAQKVMIENLAKNGIRIIVVGDPNQAIYGWRGALKGFSKIEGLLKGTASGAETNLRLPMNYRSGKAIVNYSNTNTHVKDLVAGLGHEGKVNVGLSAKSMVDEITEEFHKDKSLGEETAFISRTNAPLFGMAIKFLKEGVPFKILGSDFSKEITDFIYTVVGEGKTTAGRKNAPNTSISQFLQMMDSYVEREQRLHGSKKAKEDHLQQINKLSDALNGFISYENSKKPIATAEDMCNRIKAIFKGLDVTGAQAKTKDVKEYEALDRKRTVFLTTAHRSKGLEFTRVNIIDNGKFPQGDKPDPDNWRDQEEHNIKYVAYTRATHTLNITDDSSLEQDDEQHDESYVWRKLCSDLLLS
jgi:superfamily I DNA/RNA helicase